MRPESGAPRAYLKAIVESSPDGIFVLEEDGTVLDVNRRACEQLGYDRDELVGSDVTLFGSAPDGVPLVSDDEAVFDGTVTVEGTHTRKDGSAFPVQVRMRRIDLDGDPRLLAIARDITEIKAREQELERTNERLEEFASLVSHDLRNPLNVAAGELALAREEYDDEHLAEVADALTRMETLIEDLLTLAREGRDDDAVEVVDLATLVDRCWSNVDTTSATLHPDVDGSVRADRTRLAQVFENLFRNAVDHGSAVSDEAVAEATPVGNAADLTIRVGRLEDGFYVEDDGPGIPEDDREAVFEGGYSTDPDGTGFGLRIVREIIDAHGWSVAVVDGSDGGARFEIRDVTFV